MITALRTYPDRLVLAVAAVLWVWMLGEAAVARRISCCAVSDKNCRPHFMDGDGGGDDDADDDAGGARYRDTLLPQQTAACRARVSLWLPGVLAAGRGWIRFPAHVPARPRSSDGGNSLSAGCGLGDTPCPRSLVHAVPPADSPVPVGSARRPGRGPPGCRARDTLPQNVLAAHVRVRNHRARPDRNDWRYRISDYREKDVSTEPQTTGIWLFRACRVDIRKMAVFRLE
jgi:hypothetical protein